MRAPLAALLLAAATGAGHAAEPLLANPFGDPFERATAGDAGCPAPRGPAYTEAERRLEAHQRVERGTSCWLAGECRDSNAYRYDRGIADAALAALRGEPALAGTSIWIVAERRFVWLQGCVATPGQAARAEALVRGVPDVQLVIPMLALPGAAPRYPLAGH